MSIEPRRNVYVGHRYVPKIMGEWDNSNSYEGLSIVTYQGTSYTSKKHVPVGIDISDEEYWVVTGNYHVQVEEYRREVNDMKEEVNSKADKEYVDQELGKKSDIIYVDEELELKADKEYVDQELEKKSDIIYVDEELELKADKEYVDGELDLKADTEYVDNRIGIPIDTENNTPLWEEITTRAVNVKQFGATGDGVTDDTYAIQQAIDYSNMNNILMVYVPEGNYLISETIYLNGSSLYGVPSNLLGDNDKGSTFYAKTKTFTAISQGSTHSSNIMFNITDIYVVNALIGFEINYAINSKFERLLAKNCDTGYKLGDLTAVGTMFCEFNNLYSRQCRIGIDSKSKDWFNNNRFNNGYIQGDELAMRLEVQGGYGAVNNVFNNVEFKSSLGRGLLLQNNENTIFNNCYFETGGNAVRLFGYSNVRFNHCVYALYKENNINNDGNYIYTSGGARLTFDGGVIFISPEVEGKSFYASGNINTYDNIKVLDTIRRFNMDLVTSYELFVYPVQTMTTKKIEQNFTSNSYTIPANSFLTITINFPKPFTNTPRYVGLERRSSNYASANMSHTILSKTSTGVEVSVYNGTSSDKTISFDVHAFQD